MTTSPLVRRLLLPLCWGLAVLFAAWVAASVWWQFSAPAAVAAVPRHETDPRKAAAAILARAAPAQGAAQPAAERRAQFRVIGLATGFDGLPGFALLRAPDGAMLALRVGDALPDGRRVERIDADAVVLDGQRLPAPTVPLPATAATSSD